jgi:hypothetical protein
MRQYVLVALLLAGCGGDSNPAAPPEFPEPVAEVGYVRLCMEMTGEDLDLDGVLFHASADSYGANQSDYRLQSRDCLLAWTTVLSLSITAEDVAPNCVPTQSAVSNEPWQHAFAPIVVTPGDTVDQTVLFECGPKPDPATGLLSLSVTAWGDNWGLMGPPTRLFYTVAERTYEVHYDYMSVSEGLPQLHHYSRVQVELPEGTWRVDLNGLPEGVTACVGTGAGECLEAQTRVSFDAAIYYGKYSGYGVRLHRLD